MTIRSLTEIWGPPASGKTHSAHEGWPSPYHIDTAFTSIGFRKLEVDASEDERGESWDVVRALYDWNESEASQHYHYLSAWPNSFAFIPSETETVILDNAADLKVLAARAWGDETGNDWPQQAQWGEVNDKIDALLRGLAQDYHVVVVSQMKAEYVNGDKTGNMVRDGPKRAQYKADFRIRMEITEENERRALMVKNRHMDTTALPEMPHSLGSSVALEDLFTLAGVPESEWTSAP